MENETISVIVRLSKCLIHYVSRLIGRYILLFGMEVNTSVYLQSFVC